ncbi:hypothetical protein D3C87_1255320 [compost metagenome]
MIKVDTQTAGGAESDPGRKVARPIGHAIDAHAQQRVITAAGKAVADLRIERRQTAVLGKTQLHRSVAGRSARVRIEGDDLFVEAAEARLDHALEHRVADRATCAADNLPRSHGQLRAGNVGGDVGHPHVEFDGNAFEVVIVAIAVDHIAEVERHHLAAVGVGDDDQSAWIENALRRQSGEIRGDGQRLRAVLVTVDVECAADDEVGVAGQPAVGNERDAQRIDQRIRRDELQAVGQGDLYLIVGVVALGHQYHHAIANHFADGHLLDRPRGRVGSSSVRQTTYAGDLDGLGHGNQQGRKVTIIVERAAIEGAVDTGSFVRNTAVEAGPLHAGDVGDTR